MGHYRQSIEMLKISEIMQNIGALTTDKRAAPECGQNFGIDGNVKILFDIDLSVTLLCLGFDEVLERFPNFGEENVYDPLL